MSRPHVLPDVRNYSRGNVPKRNYGYEKRQKELKRQEKREEKRQRKLERADTPSDEARSEPEAPREESAE